MCCFTEDPQRAFGKDKKTSEALLKLCPASDSSEWHRVAFVVLAPGAPGGRTDVILTFCPEFSAECFGEGMGWMKTL